MFYPEGAIALDYVVHYSNFNEEGSVHMLEGNVAIVTGAGGSIGKAVVRKFRSLGVNVMAVDLKAEYMQALVDEQSAGKIALFEGDVADETLAPRVVTATIEAFGKVDILINNAGMGGSQVPIWEIELDEWKHDIAVNLTSQFLMCKAAIPNMIEHGYGRIVNVASAAGMEGHALSGGYGAGKGGVIAMTKILGKELAQKGVSVNAIAPALINSGMLNQPWFTEEVKNTLLGRIPMGRLGEPEEVAEMIAFLSSPELSFSTGAVFDLTGGRATY